jgi:mRNA interferase RelE/StbE
VKSWRIETAAEFEKAIRKLDTAIARRIFTYLEELASLDDPRQRGRGLTGNRVGYWRYRVGDYRVLAQVQHERLTIIALYVAHRSSVYDD